MHSIIVPRPIHQSLLCLAVGKPAAIVQHVITDNSLASVQRYFKNFFFYLPAAD